MPVADELVKFLMLYHQHTGPNTRQLRESTKRDALARLEIELQRLRETTIANRRGLMDVEMEAFKRLYTKFLSEPGPSVQWEKVLKLPVDSIQEYEFLSCPIGEQVHRLLDKLVIVKLNGGLGTSMGCKKPKSLVKVRDNLTFLDLTVQQIQELNKTYKCNVPLILMNSFNTDEDTQKAVGRYQGLNLEILTFNQSCYPRIHRESLLPVPRNADVYHNMEDWYPPGHGDFYESFYSSGLMERLLMEGRLYCFISNIDNLGATVDMSILNLMATPNSHGFSEFIMEFTDRLSSDIEGGVPVQYDGKLRLLEFAEIPKEHMDDFKSISQFKYINTNNLWVNLVALQRVVESNKLDMNVIVKHKTMADGLNVIQLETAAGSALRYFEGGVGINVPRNRFLPIKNTSDLLLLMSDLYSICNGSLVMTHKRKSVIHPQVKLGQQHFGDYEEFLRRFTTIPDLLEVDHLIVSGDVTFARGVTLRGTVVIIAPNGEHIDIPPGTWLENKILSGNLQILDH